MTGTSSTEPVATSFFKCVMPLLDSVGWRGGPNLLAQVLPDKHEEMDFEGLLNVMANLKFQSRTVRTALASIDARLLPCLFVDGHDNALVFLKRSGNDMLVFDGRSGEYNQQPVGDDAGNAVFFSRSAAGDTALLEQSRTWFSQIMARVRMPLVHAGLVSLALSTIALATPLFIRTIYDQVLASRSLTTLWALSVGIMLYIIADVGLRFVRARVLTYASLRLGNIVTNNVVRRILYLPPSYTETAPVASQVARVRDFDSVMEFFGGQAFIALLELPCTVVLFGALVIMAGPLVIVPLVAAALLAGLSMVMHHLDQTGGAGLSQSESSRAEFLLEMVENMRTIRLSGGASVWARRYRDISADSCVNTFRSARFQAISASITQGIVSSASVAAMVLGVSLVLGGDMTPGSLMSGMILVSYVLAPMRNGSDVLSQVSRIRRSAAQIDKLMSMPVERRNETGMGIAEGLTGRIKFSKVSHRYSADLPPALLGVSFDLEPGEIFVVSGHDGAGKTTILKLLLGLHRPQAGVIMLDDMSINQMDPIGIREAIGYASETTAIFDGTLLDNITLETTAERGEVVNRIRDLGLEIEVASLDRGLDAAASVQGRCLLSDSLAKGVGIARAVLRRRNVLLLDEPLRGLRETPCARLLQAIEEMRGAVTVVIASNDQRCVELGDKVLVLDKGTARSYGRPSGGRTKQRRDGK